MRLLDNIRALGTATRPNRHVSNFFFCIPLKPKSRCTNWERTLDLLTQTLRSIFNQTDPDFLLFIAGHDRPDLPELDDPRVSFYSVDFPKPKSGRQGKRDQTRKTHFLGAVAKKHGGGYFMVVDSDDLVHKDIVRFVRADDNRAAYMIRAGYVLDAQSGKLGRFSGNTPRQFFNHCGTSSIIYLTPADLPDLTADQKSFVSGASFVESVWGHGSWEAKLLEREVYPATLPFRGAVYRLNTGDNASYTYRRSADTITRLTACVDEAPAPHSILATDFGLGATGNFSSERRQSSPHLARKASQDRVSTPEKTGNNDAGRYTGQFYSERRARTLHSAKSILKIVLEYHPAQTMIDVGCGTGTWMDVAHSLGVGTVRGLEGHWLDLAQRDANYLQIDKTDLEKPLAPIGNFDLAISLEVAEHLSEERAETFVDDLCRLSKKVLFSAAIPGQGGRGHINEQWQSYWAQLFAKNNYLPLDIIRHRIWNDSEIRYWYRQNTILYCSEALVTTDSVASLPSLDMVHPALFTRKRKQYAKKLKELSKPKLPVAQ